MAKCWRQEEKMEKVSVQMLFIPTSFLLVMDGYVVMCNRAALIFLHNIEKELTHCSLILGVVTGPLIQ